MKKNYVLTLAYDGTRFGGFQKQGNNDNTIQKTLEDVFSNILSEDIEIIASGRTDAGVHAYGQVINLITSSSLEKNEILRKANEALTSDIVCKSIEQVDLRFHSRYNATSKKYLYRILNDKIGNPFTRKYSYHYDKTIDIEKMVEGSKRLLGTHDFRAFSSDKRKKKSTVRTISKIDIEKNSNEINITIEGDGFLYNMVRILAGTLLDVGTGKITVSQIEDILVSKQRSEAGAMLPPHGLYLMEVSFNKL